MDYIYCRSCGGKNPEDATFCNRCGKRLDYSIDVVDLTNVEITESTTTSIVPPPSESKEPDVKWWNNKGNEYYFNDDYKSALDCYSKATKLDPNLWAGWYNSSLALSKLGRGDEARKARKKADELGKPQPPPLSDDDKKSAQDISQTPEHKPPLDEDQRRKVSTEASVWKNRGDNSVDREQYEEAIQYYRKALELDPDYANAWHNLGFAYYKVGQTEKAQECKETAARKIGEKKRITQSTSTSKQSSEKVHLEDNIGKEKCLNCGVILPYAQGHWPVGKPKLCPKCGVRVKDPIRYGSGSGQGRTHEEQRKNPIVTGLLSIIPGLGQVYNGQLGKGLLFLFVTIIGLSIGFKVLLILIFAGLIWIFGIFEAYNTANKMNYGDVPFKKIKGINVAIYFVAMAAILLIIGGSASGLLSQKFIPNPNSSVAMPSGTPTPIIPVGGVRVVSHYSVIGENGIPNIKGIIINENPYSVSVTMVATFTDENRVVLGNRDDFISDIAPGQNAQFEIMGISKTGFYSLDIRSVLPVSTITTENNIPKISIPTTIPITLIHTQQYTTGQIATEKIVAATNEANQKIVAATNEANQKIESVINEGTQKILSATSNANEKIVAATNEGTQNVPAATNDANQKIVAATNEANEKIVAATNEANQKIESAINEGTQKILAARNQGSIQNEIDATNEMTKKIGDASNEMTKKIGDVSNEMTKKIGDASNEMTKKIISSSRATTNQDTQNIGEALNEKTQKIGDASNEMTQKITEALNEKTQKVTDISNEMIKKI